MIAANAAGSEEGTPLGPVPGAECEWPGALARAGVYRLLAAGFLEPPTPERMASFANGGLAELLGEPPASGRAEGSAEALADARQEFMALLKVPMGGFVPPYESVHRDSRMVDGEPTRGLLMGPSTVDVRRLYQDAGAGLELPELPDHIGVELGFMAFLCEGEARAEGHEEAQENYRRYQKGFLSEHVLQWVPGYCEIVAQRSTTPYMKTLAALTREFCHLDFEQME